ncbi:MAG: twin-arginine translocase TatA/TatE family subunit [Chloroflexi bacterium]|nr:twin-arginine translocase TatA/TatE family subunit [Chloroflexota bacterium]
MEILGIGPEELVLILIIALILLGPKDMQKAGRMIGSWLRKVVTSDGWKLFQQTSKEIQTLPNRLMREAQFDELKNIGNEIKGDLRQTADAVRESARVSLPASGDSPKPADPAATQNVILPSPPPPSAPPADKDKDA